MHALGLIVHDALVHLGYVGLFLVMVVGNMGVPAGTEIVVPTAGGLAAQGHLPRLLGMPAWIIVALVATLGEIVGGGLLYAVGYFGGEPFVRRWGRYVFFREQELERVHAFYARYGRNTVFLCRFIPFIRGIAGFPAGVSRMQKRWFFAYTGAGSAIFCFALAFLGQTVGRNVDTLVPWVHRFSLALLGLVIVAGVGLLVFRSASKRRRDFGSPR